MSEFSQHCKQLLLESGSNVYRFSNTYHLDHTTLQRMITGKRLPSQEFVEKFCSHLRMTPQEKYLLWELFEMERIGKTKYENRIFIRKMLEYIGDLQQRIAPVPLTLAGQSLAQSKSPICTTNPMDTSTQMTKVIMRENISSSSPLFYTNIPVTCSHFMNELKRTVGTQTPGAHIVHFLILHKNPDTYADSNYNLSILKEILPLALHDDTGYSAYYCYSASVSQGAASLIYPYYLITSTQVMLLSSDYTKAIIYTEPEIVKQYTTEFQRLLQLAKPLVRKSTSIESILDAYGQQQPFQNKIYFTFDCFPCMTRCFDLDMLQTRLRPGITISEDKILILKKLAVSLEKSEDLTGFLPVNGLRHFYETGILCDKYNDILFPLTLEQRRQVLERMARLCENGEYKLYLMPESYLPNLPQLNIEIHDNSKLFMFPMSSQNDFSFFWMDESSIYDAFYDYFESLTERRDIIQPNQVPAAIASLLA